jgi:hypothetical protein
MERGKPTERELIYAELERARASMEALPPPTLADSHDDLLDRLHLTLKYCQVLQAHVRMLDAEIMTQWTSFTRITAPFMAVALSLWMLYVWFPCSSI